MRPPFTRPTRTLHEPQSPSAQTTFVPVRRWWGRRQSERVRKASSPATRAGWPLMKRRRWSRMAFPLSIRRDQAAAEIADDFTVVEDGVTSDDGSLDQSAEGSADVGALLVAVEEDRKSTRLNS